MSSGLRIRDEQARDLLVREVPCPTCAAPTGKRCDYGPTVSGHKRSDQHIGHTSRYRVAAAQGLVPPLPGGGRG